MAGLDGGRLNIGACSLGGAQRCLDEAIAYTKDRQQFGQPISDFQNTQFMLADMATMNWVFRSEEHTSELQSLMRISYAVFCLKKKNTTHRLALNELNIHLS